jgi:hypothetical protein
VKGVASSLEAHVKRETEADDFVADELNGALDDFEVQIFGGSGYRRWRLIVSDCAVAGG